MDKFININSQEWCDIVFEGRNKRYGAYKLRQTSSKRYIVAFLVGLVIIAVISLIPQLYGVVENLAKKNLGPIEETVELSALPIAEDIPEEKIVNKEEAPPPPPPLKSTIQFTAPVIAKDEEVTNENYLKTQEELRASALQISIADIMGTDEKNGIDISDLAKPEVALDDLVDDSKPLLEAEQAPNFPGGDDALKKYLSENLKYPIIAQESGIQGKVIVKFVVSKTGDILDVQIFKGVDTSLDREAVRVVQSMPKWIPGKQKGKTVSVYFTLPIEFMLHR